MVPGEVFGTKIAAFCHGFVLLRPFGEGSIMKRMFVAAAVLLGASFLLTPSAKADIFAVENGTNCGGNFCNSGNPFELSTLLADINNPTTGGSTFLSHYGGAGGASNFVVYDNLVGDSFTIDWPGGNADVGSCQIKGMAAADFGFDACKGMNANGTSFSLGHDLTGGTQSGVFSPTTITFTSSKSLNGDTFLLEFVSMQDFPTVAAPEPSSLILLGIGMFGLVLVSAFRRTQAVPNRA